VIQIADARGEGRPVDFALHGRNCPVVIPDLHRDCAQINHITDTHRQRDADAAQGQQTTVHADQGRGHVLNTTGSGCRQHGHLGPMDNQQTWHASQSSQKRQAAQAQDHQ